MSTKVIEMTLSCPSTDPPMPAVSTLPLSRGRLSHVQRNHCTISARIQERGPHGGDAHVGQYHLHTWAKDHLMASKLPTKMEY